MPTTAEFWIEVLQAGRRLEAVEVGLDPIALGRAPTNRIVLSDLSVSRAHARITREGSGLAVSPAGTVTELNVNGQRVPRASLADGDELAVGSYVLRIRTGRAPALEQAVPARTEELADLVGVTDEQAVLETLLEKAKQLLQAQRGFVVLVRGTALAPVLVSVDGAADPDAFSRSLCQRAVQGRAPILLARGAPDGEPGAIASVALSDARSVLAVPLLDAGDVLGVLYAESTAIQAPDSQRLAPLLVRFSTVGGRALRAAIQRNQIVETSERWRWLASILQDDPDLFRTARSAAMQPVVKTVRRAAVEDITILLSGESGTGKEVTARTIHRLSSRAAGPFVAVNCGALPRELVESELFGHERGAFTGADVAKAGLLELAQDGTLLLDEIGDLPRDLQVKLLRALETRTFTRLGGRKPIEWTSRLLAATHCDLAGMVARGEFREDLYYRLNVIAIELPPLRDRLEDLELLVHELLLLSNRKYRRKLHGVEEDAIAAMKQYGWPGNIRELRNILERAFILEETDCVQASSLPFKAKSAPALTADSAGTQDIEPLTQHLERAERDHILRALKATGGNVTRAAELLGVLRQSLQRKIRQLGLNED